MQMLGDDKLALTTGVELRLYHNAVIRVLTFELDQVLRAEL